MTTTVEREQLENSPIAKGFGDSRLRQACILAFLAGLIVITAYVWLISFGRWTVWPTLSNYYDQLATAFQHGQLFLAVQPDPALLALPNPYDPETRSGAAYLPNISLYQGKYYLYFGPIPAFAAALLRPMFPGGIGDQYLVFVFVCGIFILQSLFIVRIWWRFFQDIPIWIIPLSIMTVGMMCPYSWILYTPAVNNAAITAGEFFFLAGFYLMFTTLDRSPVATPRIALTGFLWALALGARLTQIVAIGFMSLMAILWIAKTRDQTKEFSRSVSLAVTALGLPLLLGIVLLGWYNYARFGSTLETGFTYALTGQNLLESRHQFFSPVYVVQNIYNYLLIPPRVKPVFPFFYAIHGKILPIVTLFPLPKLYRSQELTGLVYSAPTVLLSIISIITLLTRKKGPTGNTIEQEQNELCFNWTTISLTGSFLFGLAPLLPFFWAAERYMADFIPSLALLAIVGFWQGYRYLARKPFVRVPYILLGITLTAITIIISNLAAISIYSYRFKDINPRLWRQLISFFSIFAR